MRDDHLERLSEMRNTPAHLVPKDMLALLAILSVLERIEAAILVQASPEPLTVELSAEEATDG